MSAHIQIDRYVLATLMRDLVGHDHRPSAFLVYLALLDVAASGRALSHAQMAEQTGLSKRAVQDAIGHLAKRELVTIQRGGRAEPAVVRPLSPWRSRANAD
ncbi:Rrf2 family transcriptional regulator [Sphingomonas crusticola]|uniref:Rrf2 family transcriptional regulator n=1 Tax=Sphingomonas crusticola TaxID=1697973 RepID=UPI000E2878BA|nr:Rrf2 family transcriptional regulator [Sphingomonas crusticola]